ncbi:MAG: pentapeptide repeat-containing protein [Candidatus Aenigmarchaeota archaeon]|nr:pentapeptide repeat-containing protein [Candidatus Aenigmarchaeota archaeon]
MPDLVYMKGEEFVRKILAGERDFSRISLEPGFNLSSHEAFARLGGCYFTNAGLGVLGPDGSWTPSDIKYVDKPIILDSSYVNGLVARGVKFPLLQARGATFEDADFSESSLQGADLEGSYFMRVKFNGADMGCEWFQGTYRGINLNRSRLHGCDLSGVKMEGAYLQHAEMWSKLRGANLREADMTQADFGSVDLRDVDIYNAIVFGTNFINAWLIGAKNLEHASGLDYAIFLNTRVSPKQREIIEAILRKRKDGSSFDVVSQES